MTIFAVGEFSLHPTEEICLNSSQVNHAIPDNWPIMDIKSMTGDFQRAKSSINIRSKNEQQSFIFFFTFTFPISLRWSARICNFWPQPYGPMRDFWHKFHNILEQTNSIINVLWVRLFKWRQITLIGLSRLKGNPYSFLQVISLL